MNKTFQLAVVLACGLLVSVSGFAKEAKKMAVDVAVTEQGFEPKSINVEPGTDVTLNVTRKTDSTCAKEIQVPSKNAKVDLPLNKTVSLALGKLEKGEVKFGCGMMMESGKLLVK